jgi:hypothetical protein
MNQYRTACGGTINISQQTQNHLIAHPDVVEHLHTAICKLRLPVVPKEIAEEIDVGQIIGRLGIKNTAPLQIRESALFSIRANRELPSRIASAAESREDTSKIVVIARPSLIENQYELITAWIGVLAMKEPWDKSIAGPLEFQECLSFWSANALVYDASCMGPVFESSWQDVLTIGKCQFL